MFSDYRKKIVRNEVRRLIGRFKDEELSYLSNGIQYYLNGTAYQTTHRPPQKPREL